MWGCALGSLEASAQMATSPRKEERKKEDPNNTSLDVLARWRSIYNALAAQRAGQRAWPASVRAS